MERDITKIFSAMIVIVLAGIVSINAQSTQKAVPSAQSKETLEQVVREYLVKNPEVIREALQALQAKEEKQRIAAAAASIKLLRSEIYSDADSPVAGNAKGDVSIVVFYDYSCGYCKRTLPALQTLVSQDSSLRVIFKKLPIMGPQSTFAARAALAAQRQGKFDAFHQAMVESQSASEDTITTIAEKLGLDHVKLLKDMDSPAITAAIERNVRLAEALGVNGTPAYLIGDELIPGAVDLAALTKIVNIARANLAKPEAEKGTAVRKGVNL